MEHLDELTLLDLRKCATVRDIVHAMAKCSFGARMLGEVALTLERWIGEDEGRIIVFDDELATPLARLLEDWVRRGWFSALLSSSEYAKSTQSNQRVLVVGAFTPCFAGALFGRPREVVFVNQYGMAKPWEIRDGYFPNMIFADPRYVMPLLDAALARDSSDVGGFLATLPPFGGMASEVCRGATTFLNMVEDPECTVFLTISGAMTIAQMGLVICDMIDEGMVDCIGATGALMAHGLVASMGLKHYKYNPAHSDTVLAEHKINRVTDTLEPETNFDHIETVVSAVLHKESGARPFSPRLFHWRIGEYLAAHFPHERGILKSAYEQHVAVLVPAFVDSEIGNDVYTHNQWRKHNRKAQLRMDMELDTRFLVNLATSSERLGIFTIGGGVPRNNIQNIAPLIEILNSRLPWLNLSQKQFTYGCRIAPDAMWHGHLSGCTYSEGESWRKMSSSGEFAEIRSDATIVWPFLVKNVMEKHRSV